ncbi:MAG: DNA polymerase III subunit delta' [Lachnospiraceae bacterium]|nr:DNA polymerase III subunit delta' [Lachnospiraceae bacterium]MDD3617319.1 DNA polymerase III subunit delta' [Lachnospiraceae bacterium]
MQGFQEVVGHEEIIAHLQNAIKLNKVSHSYIFDGETGSGKKLLATLFAMTLQCDAKGIDPCLQCPSCKKVLTKNHPDVIFVRHEKPNSIGIDEIRDQVVNDIAIKPYTGPYKIYIISDAQKLTVQAQNALLKTIEEPPEYAVVMLLTDNADSMLPTILSRCVRLQLKALSDDLVKNYLMERLHIPDYQADVSASFAKGNIGKARQIASSEDFEYMTQQSMKLLKNAGNMELYELVEMVKAMSNEKQNINEYLDLFIMWYRDVLMFKATREVDNLVFKKEINYIKEDARKRSYEGLELIIDAIEKSKNRLKANVNLELTMELLFLTIREN